MGAVINAPVTEVTPVPPGSINYEPKNLLPDENERTKPVVEENSGIPGTTLGWQRNR